MNQYHGRVSMEDECDIATINSKLSKTVKTLIYNIGVYLKYTAPLDGSDRQ